MTDPVLQLVDLSTEPHTAPCRGRKKKKGKEKVYFLSCDG